MAAGVWDHLRSIEGIAALADDPSMKTAKKGWETK
jgi:hypothetical protein